MNIQTSVPLAILCEYNLANSWQIFCHSLKYACKAFVAVKRHFRGQVLNLKPTTKQNLEQMFFFVCIFCHLSLLVALEGNCLFNEDSFEKLILRREPEGVRCNDPSFPWNWTPDRREMSCLVSLCGSRDLHFFSILWGDGFLLQPTLCSS